MDKYYVYMLHCKGDALYTGSTPDIKKRIGTHFFHEKGCAKFTRSHPVEQVAMVWETDSKSAALKAEHYIKKKLTRAEKQALIQKPEELEAHFGEESLAFTPLPHITLEMCIKKEILT